MNGSPEMTASTDLENSAAGMSGGGISTIATFGTAVDVTLAELAIEAFYPANAATAMRMLGELGAQIERVKV